MSRPDILTSSQVFGISSEIQNQQDHGVVKQGNKPSSPLSLTVAVECKPF